MPKGDFLGEFELYVLAAVEQLGDNAYSLTIRTEIESRTGRVVSFGAVYATLERLAIKGYVAFLISDPQPVPGGRARKFAHLTASGRRAMRESVHALDEMLRGLKLGARVQGHRG